MAAAARARLGGDSGRWPEKLPVRQRLDVLLDPGSFVEDGLLVVEPRSIDLGGPDFLSRATAALVRRLVTIEHAIEGLPEGLVLLDVDVQDDGVRADLEGDDVVLVEGSGS